ncbi:unnamed protein product [Pleuronectes platessa]|uniref:Uncharacterized protein n=1 Tax=Pleuronectes platessa TaxID=8262 RepID=A0A9N7V449_PLEPL|nr:unnamed protein product [Pleuronectes platessa]
MARLPLSALIGMQPRNRNQGRCIFTPGQPAAVTETAQAITGPSRAWHMEDENTAINTLVKANFDMFPDSEKACVQSYSELDYTLHPPPPLPTHSTESVLTHKHIQHRSTRAQRPDPPCTGLERLECLQTIPVDHGTSQHRSNQSQWVLQPGNLCD